MRYLTLSDIHANAQALDAVLEATPTKSYDQILCLGDLVGYGGDPNVVVERIRALDPLLVIRGNHDKVSLGIRQADDFNYVAREAAEWTLGALSASNREYLAGLPAGPQTVDDVLEICHGSPQDEDAYLFDSLDALAAAKATRRPLCLFGHTHLPCVYRLQADRFENLPAEGEIVIEKSATYLMNPGSVGQPRDGDSRAAFAIVDTGTGRVTFRRVGYRTDLARARIIAAGLPDSLAHRLELGR